jgi:hypothetical protein
VIKIIAVLCNLSAPANCHEQTVTTPDFADVSMQSCLMGAPQLAEWMNLHPAERLAGWRCVVGKQDSRGVRAESRLPGCVEPLNPKGCDY